jgi:hypothetical protein
MIGHCQVRRGSPSSARVSRPRRGWDRRFPGLGRPSVGGVARSETGHNTAVFFRPRRPRTSPTDNRHLPQYFLSFSAPGPRLSNASGVCSRVTAFDKSVTCWLACASDCV